ncbi:cobalt/zinc/cadmium resistance heavy metal efflux pump protein CzcC [Gluconobacter frateurii NBRC 101659]|nr:cobalt/zinc/cadmium resistance heavy metal efflux pump protein CzcC [Gluconobacter frateurii NBRC 101659]
MRASRKLTPLALRVTKLAGLIMFAWSPMASAASDPVLPLRTALTAAWENDPVRQELAINTQSADARAAAAKSWFAGGPVLTASYSDDRAAGTNLGYVTWQGGVSVPLWLPGQGSATEHLAQADSKAALSRVEVERMAIAVRVLEQGSAAILADRRVIAARMIVRSLEHIALLTNRSKGQGEATGVEVQAVNAQLAETRSELAQAEEDQTRSRVALFSLLGIQGVPDLLAAQAPWLARIPTGNPKALEDLDPRIKAAHRAVMAAQEDMHLARSSFMPNPEIGIDAIDQGQYGSPWATQVGVNIRVPLPSDVTHTPLLSAAQNRLAAAMRAEVEARRAVHNELAQVMARVTAARVMLLQSQTGASQTMKRADAMEHSWQLGETPLIEVLRARTEAWRALLTLNQAEVAWHSAIIRICISTGTLP